jgi:two-component system LytT family response regulator
MMLKPKLDPRTSNVIAINAKQNSNVDQNVISNVIRRKLLVNIAKGSMLIEFDDIIRCESMSNYTKIVLKSDKPILVSKTLKLIESALPKSLFLRCHNSHLINMNEVKLIEKSQLRLTNQEEIPISRQKVKEVNSSLKKMAVSI